MGRRHGLATRRGGRRLGRQQGSNELHRDHRLTSHEQKTPHLARHRLDQHPLARATKPRLVPRPVRRLVSGPLLANAMCLVLVARLRLRLNH